MQEILPTFIYSTKFVRKLQLSSRPNECSIRELSVYMCVCVCVSVAGWEVLNEEFLAWLQAFQMENSVLKVMYGMLYIW